MRGMLITTAVVAGLLTAGPVYAQVGVRVAEVPEGGVRIDGSLRDWRRIRFARLGSGADASFRYAVGADARGFYLAAEVSDNRMVRTQRPSTTEDALVLTFAMPRGNGYRGTDVWIYAGIPGRQAGAAGVASVGGRPRTADGIRVVEGPRRNGAPGYVVEAFVPFRAVAGAARWQDGRMAIRLVDVDREARPEVEDEVASARVDPRNLGRLPSIEAEGGNAGMLRAFLQDRGLEGTRPRFDLRGDVQGDGRPERIVVVDTYVLAMGPGFRDGNAYDIFQLPITTAADVRAGRLVDLTGDGKKELVLTIRQRGGGGSRDLWHSFSFDGAQIRPQFGVEVRKETQEGFIEAEVNVRRARRGPALVVVRAGRARGLTPETFREARATEVEAILLPWGPVSERVYQWDGSRFATLRETENPRAHRESSSENRSSSETTTRTRPTAPSGPTIREMVAAFKRQAGLPGDARPSTHVEANLAEGRTEEHLFVFGTHLLVVGTRFRRGANFFHFQIPAASADDVVSVRTADLTADGREEVLIRVRRPAGDVQREILLVQQFRPTEFARIGMIEVARSQEGNSIRNEVRIQGRGRGARLTIRPGRARGWNASSWPFADGTGDGVDPLLLPWRDRAVTYSYSGGRLRR
jgi:hypothetical protein